MSEPWYEAAPPDHPLTQGDLILDCPLLVWDPAESLAADEGDPAQLNQAARNLRADVVVMTQACDLEHGKVRQVVLCPSRPLTEYRAAWESALRTGGHNPTAKAWKKTCRDIADGHVWNQKFLNSADLGEGDLRTEVRVAEFREVFTAPRSFLEALLRHRGRPRLRLLPPYREHLSQAFARFFMRVGLPQSVAPEWEST